MNFPVVEYWKSGSYNDGRPGRDDVPRNTPIDYFLRAPGKRLIWWWAHWQNRSSCHPAVRPFRQFCRESVVLKTVIFRARSCPHTSPRIFARLKSANSELVVELGTKSVTKVRNLFCAADPRHSDSHHARKISPASSPRARANNRADAARLGDGACRTAYGTALQCDDIRKWLRVVVAQNHGGTYRKASVARDPLRGLRDSH